MAAILSLCHQNSVRHSDIVRSKVAKFPLATCSMAIVETFIKVCTVALDELVGDQAIRLGSGCDIIHRQINLWDYKHTKWVLFVG